MTYFGVVPVYARGGRGARMVYLLPGDGLFPFLSVRKLDYPLRPILPREWPVPSW